MSAPVDVLAMLDERIAVERAGMIRPDKLIAIRAAVAELIEAADEAAMRLSLVMKHSEDIVAHMRLCAALARVQGEQA